MIPLIVMSASQISLGASAYSSGANTSDKKSVTEPNHCKSFQGLTSVDRTIVSDTRYALSLIDPKLPENIFSGEINRVLTKYSSLFKKESMANYLQSLIAEIYLKRLVYNTIGLSNIVYKKYIIFIDLITYHRAMSHLGFVSDGEFLKSKTELINEINNYVEKKQKPIIDAIKEVHPLLISDILMNKKIDEKYQSLAHNYLELDKVKSQAIGLIELIWMQSLNRNDQNRMEVRANNAITDVTVSTAAAIAGISVLVTYAIASATATTTSYAFTSLADTLWSVSVQAAIGCGLGLSGKFAIDTLNASYLEITKAFYTSFKNKTSFACELGDVADKGNSSKVVHDVEIPDVHAPPTKQDYLLACVAAGGTKVAPSTIGVLINGIAFAMFASSSYTLAKEAMVVLDEVPNLVKLKEKAQAAREDTQEMEALNDKINESESKMLLYIIAMGNTSFTVLKTGIYLYINNDRSMSAIGKAKNFLANMGKSGSSTAGTTLAPKANEVDTVKLLVDKLN